MKAQLKRADLIPASVLICVPAREQVYTKFMIDLIAVRDDLMHEPTPGYFVERTGIDVNQGSMIWNQRAWLLENAVKRGFTHALFIDTDQTLPRNAGRRLLAHGLPIVACNVAIKQIPSLPTARRLVGGKAVPVFTLEDSTGLEQVWRVGTGVMMIDLSVLDKIEQPWFKVDSGAEAHRHGEDWWFIQQLERAGIPIYIDHDVSRQVGHLGVFEYHHGHVPEELIAEAMAMEAEGESANLPDIKPHVEASDANLQSPGGTRLRDANALRWQPKEEETPAHSPYPRPEGAAG